MKLIHLSDLHLGKKLNEYSLIEDQKYILSRIINIIDDENPNGVIIAGDVYDKSVPSAEAVELFDDFLVRLSEREAPTFIISGNHDSAERLAFGGRIMDNSGIHLSPVYSGEIKPVTLRDSYGDVNIYMLPFVKPSNVRRFFPDAVIESYTDALRVAIDGMNIDKEKRNILITHQFVTGAERSESEDISVGGADNVDAAVFSDFDYVALGHLHEPQNVGCEKIRYCGTPLKYSFSEAGHEKSVTVAELGEKGELSLRCVPLIPLHDMKELRGTFAGLTEKSFYEDTAYCDDYIRITLTDEDDIPDAAAKLRVIYRNLMRLDYDNTRTRWDSKINDAPDAEKKSPEELFAELYYQQNGTEMTDTQKKTVSELAEKIWSK